MVPTAPLPDALYYPESRKRGATLRERIDSVLDVAEPLLGVDRTKGQRAYVRRQGDGWLFISRSPHDTILFSNGHAMRGRPRYRWIEDRDGIRRGYLSPEAAVEQENPLAIR